MENSRFKFRVWDNKDKIFLQDINIRQDGKCFCKFKGEFYDGRLSEVEQCTGLKDKNGVLIYEGDILIDKYGKTAEIRFDKNSMFQCYVRNGSGKFMFYTSYSLEPNYMANSEVIGNIHQNKELLD